MNLMSVADAKAHLSAVIERAEAGETVCITRRGKPVARVVPIDPPREPFDWDALERHAAGMPPETEDSGIFMRRMRDSARY